MNREALLAQMDAFIDEFTLFRDLIEKGEKEKMREKMRASTARRALFDKPVPKQN